MDSRRFPVEYRIPVSQDNIRSFKDPNLRGVTTTHALVKIRYLANGDIPDKINPRSHEDIRITPKIPRAIRGSLEDNPEVFHLLNRGCLIIAKKAWYDNGNKILHFVIESEDDHGMVDGATTDRVLAQIKRAISSADFSTLKEDEIPDYFDSAHIHLEIISGEVDQDLRVKLADARNTSMQVKEFSLEDLKGNFDWLKKILDESEFNGKIRYRENSSEPVDIRIVLALLTMFHPVWKENGSDPIKSYTSKGGVLSMYTKESNSYQCLAPVVTDILKLYEHIHFEFGNAYRAAYGNAEGKGARLGGRKEVRHIGNAGKAKKLPLTGKTTQYIIPDGWLYPLLGAFRMLLEYPNDQRTVKWTTNPFDFFERHGKDLVYFLVERSEELGRNANATGKSKGVWLGLRNNVENLCLKIRLQKLER